MRSRTSSGSRSGSSGALPGRPDRLALTLILGRLPEPLWRFFSSLVRYATHVLAFVLLAGNPFPGFTGRAGSYPVDLEIDDPVRQNRWKTLFRLVLAWPAQLLAAWLLVVPMFGTVYDETTGQTGGYFYLTGVGLVVAVLAWFACMVRGRMPTGFRDLLAYSLRYNAQTWGYLLLVTDRYPHAHPNEPAPEPPPYRPVAVTLGDDDLRRSRLAVFFRLLLALPHLVWLVLWSVAALVVIVVGWFAALAVGRLPAVPSLPRRVAPLPGARLRVPHARRQPVPQLRGSAAAIPSTCGSTRPSASIGKKTLFRLVLSYPANLVAWTLTSALWIVALFGWFVGSSSAACRTASGGSAPSRCGYTAPDHAYLYLLTDRYPYSGPPEVDAPPGPEPLFAWPGRCARRRSRRSRARGRLGGRVVALADLGPVGLRLPDVAADEVLAQPELRRGSGLRALPPLELRGLRSRADRHRSPSTRVTASGSPGSPRRAASARGCSSACSASRSSAVQIPFEVVDLWWQRRHDVSELGYVDWFFLNWFALGGSSCSSALRS